MRCDALALSLLEFLAYKAGCPYLSDLPRVIGWQRVRVGQPARLERRAGLPDRRAAGENGPGRQGAADPRAGETGGKGVNRYVANAPFH